MFFLTSYYQAQIQNNDSDPRFTILILLFLKQALRTSYVGTYSYINAIDKV